MDKYDDAVEHFTQNPEDIRNAWFGPQQHEHGCLFSFLAPTGKGSEFKYGCLTMIKPFPGSYRTGYSAVTFELTEQIINDPEVPYSMKDITVDNLHVFAKYQRLADEARTAMENL